jgi:type IV pilus assembly protein PilQ
MVRTLDIPIKQVLIESRIVVVNDDFSREFGMRLGVTAFNENSSDGVTAISGTGDGTDTMINSALGNLADPSTDWITGGSLCAGCSRDGLSGRPRTDGARS